MHINHQFFQHHLLKRQFFLQWITFGPLSKVSWLTVSVFYLCGSLPVFLNAVLLTYLYILLPTLHCFDSCSSMVSIWLFSSPSIVCWLFRVLCIDQLGRTDILEKLNLPTHVHEISCHLFRSLISFISFSFHFFYFAIIHVQLHEHYDY